MMRQRLLRRGNQRLAIVILAGASLDQGYQCSDRRRKNTQHYRSANAYSQHFVRVYRRVLESTANMNGRTQAHDTEVFRLRRYLHLDGFIKQADLAFADDVGICCVDDEGFGGHYAFLDTEIDDTATNLDVFVSGHQEFHDFASIQSYDLQHQITDLAAGHYQPEAAVRGRQKRSHRFSMTLYFRCTVDHTGTVAGELDLREKLRQLQLLEIDLGFPRRDFVAGIYRDGGNDVPASNRKVGGINRQQAVVDFEVAYQMFDGQIFVTDRFSCELDVGVHRSQAVDRELLVG